MYDLYIASLLFSREVEYEKTLGASRPRIRCPLCGWSPRGVRAGRRIPIGMQNERATATFIAPNDKPVKDR
jgi:hypothetical protein